jgi:hypothetical protein
MEIIIKLLLLVALNISLYASRILDYNIYDRSNRIDMVLIFDTPYKGKIKQSIKKSKIIINLENSYIKSSVSKKLSSKFLQSLTINQMGKNTQIVAYKNKPVSLKASRRSDAHTLTLRFTKKMGNTSRKSLSTALPTKKESDMQKSYYIVSIILIIGILFLFAMKKKITQKQQNKLPTKDFSPDDKENVTIRFQKKLDENNGNYSIRDESMRKKFPVYYEKEPFSAIWQFNIRL